MKTSIILSSYNGAEYIEEQLNSLLTQTRPADEVLFFDDCSSDNTPALIESFIQKNNLTTWTLYRNKENIGWRKNFIHGMSCCHGDIIFPCDQDDIWLPEKVQKMTDVMEQHEEINLLVSSYTAFYPNGTKETLTPPPVKFEAFHDLLHVSLPDNLLNVPYPGCTYCVRKSFFDLCIPYWIETFPHDALFWRIAELQGSSYILNEPLILWRKHMSSAWSQEAQTVTIKSELGWRNVELKELQQLQQFCKKQKLSQQTTDFLNTNLIWCSTRKDFLMSKNILSGIKLFRFLKQYGGPKRWAKDWFIVFFR